MAAIRGQIISGEPGRVTVGVYQNGAAGGTQPNDQVQPRSNIQYTPDNDYHNSYIGNLNANDRGIVRERNVFLSTGTEKSGRLSGYNDPILDGPARPSLVTLNRTINTQQGTGQANEDDLSRAYTKTPSGQWAGQQDGSVQPIYGGTPGMWIPYGSRGGVSAGEVQGVQSPVLPGGPGDGPQRINAGPPHGLHTATLANGAQMWARYNTIPQMANPITSRPYNSKIAGQSYSQTIVPLGSTPTQMIRPRVAGGNMGAQTAGRGWRGR